MASRTVPCPHCLARVPVAGNSPVVCSSCEAEFTPTADPPAEKPPVVAKRVESKDVPYARSARPTSRPRSNDAPRRRQADRTPPKKMSAGLLVLIIVGAVFGVLVVGGVMVVVVQQVQNAARPSAITAPKQNLASPPPANVAGTLNVDPPQPPANPPPPQKDLPKPPPRVEPNYPPVVPVAITPAKLDGKITEVKLPGTVANTCVGGGGRFLILQLSDKRQVAVFDVCEAKVVKLIDVHHEKVLFAAGMNVLIVADPDGGRLVRYDLVTFEQKGAALFPLRGTLRNICMGSASAGPLLVSYKDKDNDRADPIVTLLDPVTCQELTLQVPKRVHANNDPMHFRAAPDGTHFTGWSTGSNPFGLSSYVIIDRNGAVGSHYQHVTLAHGVPGADGRVYTGRGVFTSDLVEVNRAINFKVKFPFLLPSSDGYLHLRLDNGDPNPDQWPEAWPGHTRKVSADVRMDGEDQPLATIPDLGPFPPDQKAKDDLTIDRRVHFVPTAGVLVTLPATNDKLVLHPFDMAAAAKAKGVNVLAVTSRPPTAVPGQRFEYLPVVKSMRGGVKIQKDAGPSELTIYPDGRISWRVPADFKTPVPIVLAVSDASGREVLHAFTLNPGDGKGFADPIVPPVAPPPEPPEPRAWKRLTEPPYKVLQINPAPVKETTTIDLPGYTTASCLGGGGRFLICRLPANKQLAVIDLNLAKVVKFIPISEDDSPFAAGMRKLFVINKTVGVIQRYDLETFDRELTVPNLLGGNPSLLLTGYAADGPVFVGGTGVGINRQSGGFIDPATLKPFAVSLEADPDLKQPARIPGIGDGGVVVHPTQLAVSPDGLTYQWLGHKEMFRMTFGEKKTVVSRKKLGGEQNSPVLRVGPDGSVFTIYGAFAPDLSPLGDTEKQTTIGTFTPAASGNWYVTAVDKKGGDHAKPVPKYTVRLTSDPTLELPLNGPDADTPGKITAIRPTAIHLVPEAEVLAVVGGEPTKIHLHRVSLKELLDKSGPDYLLVLNRPRLQAPRQAYWTYRPEVWSKKGGVKVEVVKGPQGMGVIGDSLGWMTPKQGTDTQVAVEMKITDASGKSVTQAFTLTLLDP